MRDVCYKNVIVTTIATYIHFEYYILHTYYVDLAQPRLASYLLGSQSHAIVINFPKNYLLTSPTH